MISIKDLDRAQELALNFTASFPNNNILRRGVSGINKTVIYSTEAERLYTSSLFDNFAKSFDITLGKLNYDMPEKLVRAACAVDGGADLDILDAGCGTGLCGAHLRARARHLVGVDLSANMLAKAREKNLYDDLVETDLVYFMENNLTSFDLVVSADVLNYIGDITPLARAAYLALRSRGVCVVSIESLNDHVGTPFLLAPSGRYQHTSLCVRETFTAAGFTVDPLQETSVRLEHGIPVPAWIVLARK
jgi:predicted TPR repeat methyltransferase